MKPKILVIDDVYGCCWNNRNRQIEDFCVRLELEDVTGNCSSEDSIENPIAEAVFCSGQILKENYIQNDLEGTLKKIKVGWDQSPRWALILLDLHFATGTLNENGKATGVDSDRIPENYFGLTILEALHNDRITLDIPIVLLSAMEREKIEKRFSGHALGFVDKTDISKETLKEQLFLNGLLEDSDTKGHSVYFLECLRQVRRACQGGNSNALILGNSGTGKELIAEYFHKHSPNLQGPFIPLFTQGVPESLIEDRLFGHKAGAFNGAKTDQPGQAELANNGTLFIDEFGDIPPTVLIKLLRLMDPNLREVQRLGDNQIQTLNLQIVMATNHKDILSTDDFRINFTRRVDAIIDLPDLRERPEDIPLFVEYFINKFTEKYQAEPRKATTEALERLKAYPWPGNVGQLEKVIEKAIRDYKYLRILHENHLTLEEPEKQESIEKYVPTTPREHATSNINDLISFMDAMTFSACQPADLRGKLDHLQASYARLLAKYITAAFKATSKNKTEQNPDGELNLEGAMKLITGNNNLKGKAPGQLFKRLFKNNLNVIKKLNEPLLNEAAKRAEL